MAAIERATDWLRRHPRTRARTLRSILILLFIIIFAVDQHLVRVPTNDEMRQTRDTKYRSSEQRRTRRSSTRQLITSRFDADRSSAESLDPDDQNVIPPAADPVDMSHDVNDIALTAAASLAHNALPASARLAAAAPTTTTNVSAPPSSAALNAFALRNNPAAAPEPVSQALLDAVVQVVRTKGVRSIAVSPCGRAAHLLVRLVPLLRRLDLRVKTTCISSDPSEEGSAREIIPPAVHCGYALADMFSAAAHRPLGAHLYLVWPGLDHMSATSALTYFDNVRRSGARLVAVGVFRHVPLDDEAYGAWRNAIEEQGLDARRVHDLTLPPFMFGHPRMRFTGVDSRVFRELFVYDTSQLVNEFA